jgi:hypothetical protein
MAENLVLLNKSIIRSDVDVILNPEVEFDTDMNSSEGEE